MNLSNYRNNTNFNNDDKNNILSKNNQNKTKLPFNQVISNFFKKPINSKNNNNSILKNSKTSQINLNDEVTPSNFQINSIDIIPDNNNNLNSQHK